MNKYFKQLAVIGLSATFLAGCGTDGDSAANKPSAKPASASEETKDDTVNEQQDEKKSEGIIRILEQNIKYSVNGAAKEETAFLKHSDNQNYSMYVLPGYELTSEEPNKDVLFWSEDDSVFMRIELLPPDIEWSSIEENTKSQLAVVNEDLIEANIPEDPFYKDSWAMEASNDTETVTAFLIKNEEQPLKLTMFTKKDADHKEPFLEMGKTILKEKKECCN